jgi:ParB-like chromosome segregation protein Spo0J
LEDVAIVDLVGPGLVDPDRHLDQELVARFALVLDDLPPVTVYRLPDGLLLVDGYHRLAAARRLGRTTVRAEVVSGTKADALAFATALAVRERNLSEQQVRDAIERRSGGAWGAPRPD